MRRRGSVAKRDWQISTKTVDGDRDRRPFVRLDRMRLVKNLKREGVMGPPGTYVGQRLFGAPAVITQAMVAA